MISVDLVLPDNAMVLRLADDCVDDAGIRRGPTTFDEGQWVVPLQVQPGQAAQAAQQGVSLTLRAELDALVVEIGATTLSGRLLLAMLKRGGIDLSTLGRYPWPGPGERAEYDVPGLGVVGLRSPMEPADITIG